MVRSYGFGFNTYDFSPFKTRFPFDYDLKILILPNMLNCISIMQKVLYTQLINFMYKLISNQFQIISITISDIFSPFLRSTISLSDINNI